MNSSGNSRQVIFVTPRIDAGAGALFTIKSWGKYQKIQPLSIRFDMPLYLSDRPYVDNTGNFAFRWVVGINRAF
jgi:hypothetical protein